MAKPELEFIDFSILVWNFWCFFRINRVFHDKQIWQVGQKLNAFFPNYRNLNFNGKGYLIFPVLARFRVLRQIISTHNNKE